MIIILKRNANKEKVENLKTELVNQGFKLHLSEGTEASLIGLIGDTSRIHEDWLKANDVVEDVRRIREPYKKANRSMHPDDTVIDVCGRKIGGGSFQVIAGPCSIETKEQITEVAEDVKRSGAAFLRGGAFKPRTSPYAFQGLHEQGLDLLLEAKKATGLPVVTEIMSAEHLPLFDDVDIIQVGARNMQNFELLKVLGTPSRNKLDPPAIPTLTKKTPLPVIVDPRHAAGIRFMVEPLAMAAIAAGADGLMIEVHNNPEKALCDGAQSLTPEMFDHLMKKVDKAADFFHSLG